MLRRTSIPLFWGENGAELLNAKELWGKSTSEIDSILKKRHGKDVSVACIGPAGEKLVKYACIKGFHAFVNAFTDRIRYHRSDLWYKLVDIVKAYREKIAFCVVDAVTAMEGDGPIHGLPVHMGLIIAGDDPVATDSIAAVTIGYKAPYIEIGPIAIPMPGGLV
ncbi:MAG: hypothetical protein DRN90_04805 [Thermoproteota archaeon]|nr:MAG: hypothetical protein DRN92_03915 [Candidatus Korarchaeota archaeon]RLG47557.1 MAG: hypothetical protein DRN90_04805 [Candidatus Korarchaeota archaeon]